MRSVMAILVLPDSAKARATALPIPTWSQLLKSLSGWECVPVPAASVTTATPGKSVLVSVSCSWDVTSGGACGSPELLPM